MTARLQVEHARSALFQARDRFRRRLIAVVNDGDGRPWRQMAGACELLLEDILRQQQAPLIVGYREYAALAILSRTGVEAGFAGLEVDLLPFEREYFAVDAPAGEVGELDHGAQRRRQVRDHAGALLHADAPGLRLVLEGASAKALGKLPHRAEGQPAGGFVVGRLCGPSRKCFLDIESPTAFRTWRGEWRVTVGRALFRSGIEAAAGANLSSWIDAIRPCL